MTPVTFRIDPIGTAGAAEVVGLDCSRPLAADDLARVKAAFLEYPILAFRDQALTPAQQARFSAQFGALINEENTAHRHPDDPYVMIISNELRPDGTAVGVVDAGDYFHADSSHKTEPVHITCLQSVRNPSTGGQTEFVNMRLVYDALPDDLRRAVDGRFAWHHASKLLNPRTVVSPNRPGAADFYADQAKNRPEVLQPVVRTHPETGRKSLYVSPRFALRIEGMDATESETVLVRIFRMMIDDAFVYRHEYRDGDLVMWDNRCLNHRATGGYALPDIRRMHRTTTQDAAPF
jgi:taurine dioxygenase